MNDEAPEGQTAPPPPANSALCLMIFPSTSSLLLADVDMLMRICSDCSRRSSALGRFFHTPQICRQTDRHGQVSRGGRRSVVVEGVVASEGGEVRGRRQVGSGLLSPSSEKQ